MRVRVHMWVCTLWKNQHKKDVQLLWQHLYICHSCTVKQKSVTYLQRIHNVWTRKNFFGFKFSNKFNFRPNIYTTNHHHHHPHYNRMLMIWLLAANSSSSSSGSEKKTKQEPIRENTCIIKRDIYQYHSFNSIQSINRSMLMLINR